MTKRQKTILIPIISVIAIYILSMLILMSILGTKEKDKKPNYDYLIPFENYTKYDQGDYCIYYETINGYLSSNRINIYSFKGHKVEIERHIKDYDTILDINYDIYDNLDTLTKTHYNSKNITEYTIQYKEIIYCVFNRTMTPVAIVGCEVKVGMDKIFDYVCVNLNTSSYIDYKEIAYLE